MALSAAEEETLDSLKRWWNESGKQLALGIAVVAVGYFAWQFWQNSQSQQAASASAIYDRMSQLIVVAPGQPVDPAGAEQARGLINTLKTDHSETVYALYAALFAAQLDVLDGNLQSARQELEWLLDNTQSGFFANTDESLIRLAQLRLGRIMLSQGETEAALDLVNSVDGQAMQAEFDEMKGDIHLERGERDLALPAYEAAAAAGTPTPILEMKITELQGAN